LRVHTEAIKIVILQRVFGPTQGGAVMEKNRILATIGGVALLAVGGQAFGAVNYNSSKSNTGNVTAHGTCKPGVVKGCTPRPTHAAARPSDLGSGQLVGRRRHQPLTAHRTVDSTSPKVFDAHRGASTGKRRHQAAKVHKPTP
jgi:hypothetical protein